MALPRVCTNRISNRIAGGLVRQLWVAKSSRLRQVRGKVEICARAVLAYGDKRILALTKKLAKPAGFDQEFSHTQTRRFCQGFTFIEVMMVIGLLVIVASLGLFMSMETLRGGSFRNDRAAAVSALQRARSLAVNNMCFGGGCAAGEPHGVHFDAAGMVIFQGDSYDAGAAVNEIIKFDSKTTTLESGSADEIIFRRLSGNLITDTGATSTSVTLTDGMNHESEITVNSEGRIDWTN